MELAQEPAVNCHIRGDYASVPVHRGTLPVMSGREGQMHGVVRGRARASAVRGHGLRHSWHGAVNRVHQTSQADHPSYVDWRVGAEFFEMHLVDYDTCSKSVHSQI